MGGLAVPGRAGRHVKRRVPVEEPGRLEHEPGPLSRHNRPIFRPSDVDDRPRRRKSRTNDDLTCVKLVIDTQAAGFPPVASWRATTSVPSADQCRLCGGLAQFSHEVLRKATHNAITLCRDKD